MKRKPYKIRLEIPVSVRDRAEAEERAADLAAALGGRVREVVQQFGVRSHGTRYCYEQGCRRPECVRANRLYMRKWNRQRIQGGKT